jgi:hypothetical protein
MIIALLLAGQIATTTTCNSAGSQVRCESVERPTGFGAYNAARDRTASNSNEAADVMSAFAAGARARREAEQNRAADLDLMQRRAVGNDIAKGNCEAARLYALNQGRFDLVEMVRDHCRSAQSQ